MKTAEVLSDWRVWMLVKSSYVKEVFLNIYLFIYLLGIFCG